MYLFLTLLLLLSVTAGVPAASALPPGATLLPAESAPAFSLNAPQDGSATLSRVPVMGQTFTTALHVQTTLVPQYTWQTQVLATTVSPVKRGDILLLTLWTRVLKPNDGSAKVGAIVEVGSGDYAKSLDRQIAPSGVWKRSDFPFKALNDYATGGGLLSLTLGGAVQTVEIGGISLTDYGPNVDLDALPQTRLTYEGREADAPWRKDAAARIEKYRKGSLTVQVFGADGKPVQNASVHVQMTKHAFLFGTAFRSDVLLGKGVDSDRYRTEAAKLFNLAAPENELKWPWWQGSQKDGRAMIAWVQAHDMHVRGQNLQWPSWQWSPPALKSEFDRRSAADGSEAARAWLAEQCRSHVTDEASALKGEVSEWDVVNEPLDNRDLLNILGDAAMTDWFQAAHAAAPAARLVINDNGTLYGQEPDERLRQRLALYRRLFASGAPISGIGLESHISPNGIPSVPQILKSFDTFGAFGVPLIVTEYDFTTEDPQLQADYTRDFLTLAFANPHTEGFVMWGFWDGSHWLGNAPVFGKDWTLKPAGQQYEDLVLKRWWTQAQGATNARGTYETRGFSGDYTIGVTHGGVTKTVSTFLPQSGRHVTVTF